MLFAKSLFDELGYLLLILDNQKFHIHL
jgi:hypothetical protein